MLLLAFALTAIPVMAAEKNKATSIDEFYAFFNGKEAVNYNELVDALGKPTSRTPLLINEDDEDIREDHAWLHYKLNGNVLISVTCSKGVVGHVEAKTGDIREIIWTLKKAPRKKP